MSKLVSSQSIMLPFDNIVLIINALFNSRFQKRKDHLRIGYSQIHNYWFRNVSNLYLAMPRNIRTCLQNYGYRCSKSFRYKYDKISYKYNEHPLSWTLWENKQEIRVSIEGYIHRNLEILGLKIHFPKNKTPRNYRKGVKLANENAPDLTWYEIIES